MQSLEAILRSVNVPDNVRADAWDAFQQSKDENDLASRIQGMTLPQDTKAVLWDLKKAGSQNQALSTPLPINTKYGPPSPPAQYSAAQGFMSEAKANAIALAKAARDPMGGVPGAQLRDATPGDYDRFGLISGAVPSGSAATTFLGQLADSPAAQAIKSIYGKIPTTAKAGQKFEQVMGAAKDVPIDLTNADEAIARAKELRQRGSTLPKVLNDYIKNRAAGAVNMPNPMTYEVGRDFASNAGALSIRETTAMNAKMQRQVAEFADAMKTANREAAAKVGMGELYDQAMKEYHQAKNLIAAGKIVKKGAVEAILGGTALALAKKYVLGQSK